MFNIDIQSTALAWKIEMAELTGYHADGVVGTRLA